MVSVAALTSPISRSTSAIMALTAAATVSSSSRLPLTGILCWKSPAAMWPATACMRRSRRIGWTLSATPQAKPMTMISAPLQSRAEAVMARISRASPTSRPTTSSAPDGKRRARMRM